jgi:hypothetical protein
MRIGGHTPHMRIGGHTPHIDSGEERTGGAVSEVREAAERSEWLPEQTSRNARILPRRQPCSG